MTSQEAALVAIAGALERLAVPFMLIGGHATAIWGTPRATLDIDITVWASETDAERIASGLPVGFKVLTREPVVFVRDTRVLPIAYREDVRIDMIFGLLPFEQQAIERAHSIEMAGTRIPVISAEDLILMKIVSTRPRDLGDIESIVDARAAVLDLHYLTPRIEALADSLPELGVRERWQQLRNRAGSRW
jgi:hypothetical protein